MIKQSYNPENLASGVIFTAAPPGASLVGTYGRDGVLRRARSNTTNSDGVAVDASADELEIISYNYLFNETTWDRIRNNTNFQILASAARTASLNSADITNFNAKGIIIVLNITAVSGTAPTLDVKVQVKDTLTGNYIDLPSAVFAQANSVSSQMLNIYPGVAETANVSVSDIIPRTFRLVATIAGTTPSFTFSLFGCLVI